MASPSAEHGGEGASAADLFGARRILVLAPHPDDEVVGCAIAIRRARANGAEIWVLHLTTGVPATGSPRQAGRTEQRRAEALEAAALLGIRTLPFTDWPSRELKSHLAEGRALVDTQARAVRADAIWTPAYEGGHQDHDVTNFIASTFAPERQVVEFSEYNSVGGRSRGRFPTATGGERVLQPSADEAAWKTALIAVYRSERANLAHVVRRRIGAEGLRPLPRHDYTRPPHPGRLFYERFHWVPFRHPRVDFTTSDEICAALSRFQRQTAAFGNAPFAR